MSKSMIMIVKDSGTQSRERNRILISTTFFRTPPIGLSKADVSDTKLTDLVEICRQNAFCASQLPSPVCL